jgi:hypothetical protein
MASDDVAASGVDPPPSLAGDEVLVSLPASTDAPELPVEALASGSTGEPDAPDEVPPWLGSPDAVDPDALAPAVDAVDPVLGSLVPEEGVEVEPEPPLSPPVPEAAPGVTPGLDALPHPAESRKNAATGNESFMVDLDPKSPDGLNTAHGGRTSTRRGCVRKFV